MTAPVAPPALPRPSPPPSPPPSQSAGGGGHVPCNSSGGSAQAPPPPSPAGGVWTLQRRRSLLRTTDTPLRRYPALIAFSGRLGEAPGGRALPAWTTVRLRYLPDRLILTSSAFSTYLAALPAALFRASAAESAPASVPVPAAPEAEEARLAALAAVVVEDVANEVLPLWLQLTLVSRSAGMGGSPWRLVVEDRQPGWDDPTWLARIAFG